MSKKHTDLPLTVGAAQKGNQIHRLYFCPVYSASHTFASGFGHTIDEATVNAEFIVRAVNNHEQLVEALEAMLEFEGIIEERSGDYEIGLAKQALKAARGEL